MYTLRLVMTMSDADLVAFSKGQRTADWVANDVIADLAREAGAAGFTIVAATATREGSARVLRSNLAARQRVGMLRLGQRLRQLRNR